MWDVIVLISDHCLSIYFTLSAVMGFSWIGTQERVKNSCCKRAISVQATKVLLYTQVLSLCQNGGKS